jgi:hypothetical protein
MSKECTCGDTGYHWLPDENQAEANCWECHYRADIHLEYGGSDINWLRSMEEDADEEEILPW